MAGVSALFGALGLVFIAFGLVSLILYLAGAPSDLRWIVANFGIGVVLLGGGLVANAERIGERLRSSEGRRIGKYGTSAVAQTLILLAIIGLFAFLSTRYHHRFDITEAGVHSLSDRTEKVLGGLERDVEVVALVPTARQIIVRDLLSRYEYANPRFRVEYADPNTRPDLVESEAVTPERLESGILQISIGDSSVEVDEITEEKVTNALVQLTRSGERVVYFLVGHNEHPALGEGSEEAGGFSLARQALENENYRVETLLLAATGDVPEDAEVVVVAGATRPLLTEESRALERYLERGGALWVGIDPRANTNIGDDLDRWGVEVGEDIILDRVQGMFGRPMSPLAGEYANHEITRGLREATLFEGARSVQPQREAGGKFTAIVRTSDNSWAERDLERLFGEKLAEYGDDDLRGPVALAVAGSPLLDGDVDLPDGAEPRLVVFGDSDFASNQFIDVFRNRDLFVNSISWLIGDVEAISIRPPSSRASRLALSQSQFAWLSLLSLFVLPQIIMVVGVFVWWRRRTVAS